MGWVWLGVIGVAALAMLWLAGASRALGTLTAAALLVGGAGYALQNNASLAGRPARADVRRIAVDPGLVAFRTIIMPGNEAVSAILAEADQRLRDGDTTGAAQWMLDALSRRPDDVSLWTGLGSVLVAHDGGKMSPAAQLAFRRAIQLAPNEPGPRFFLGLAYLQEGDLPAVRQAWRLALSLTPQNAPYRVLIAERLMLIDQLTATQTKR